MSNQLKLGHKKKVGLTTKTSFEVIESGQCRRVMLKFTNKDLTEADNAEIKRSKHAHLQSCEPCHLTFSTQGYFEASDTVFAITTIFQIYDASKNGTWETLNGKAYFYTDDMVGADFYNDDEVGACIKVLTGNDQLQGRVASKIYSVLQCCMDIGFNKIFVFKKSIDVRRAHKDKLELFHKVLSRYFLRVIWTDYDASNEYLKEVGRIVYEYFDVVANVAKVITIVIICALFEHIKYSI